jgi:hypothetical protein
MCTTEKRHITYVLNHDNKTKFMMFDQGSIVQTFLNLARARNKRDDLLHIWTEGSFIDLAECIDEYWSIDTLFLLSSTDDAPDDAFVAALMRSKGPSGNHQTFVSSLHGIAARP